MHESIASDCFVLLNCGQNAQNEAEENGGESEKLKKKFFNDDDKLIHSLIKLEIFVIDSLIEIFKK